VNPQYDPSLIDKVPPSIVSAAMAVSNWFNSQSLHPSPRWEFLSICSRNHADRLKKLERELDFAMTNESIETNENHKLRQRIKRLEEDLMDAKNKHAALVADVALYEDRGDRIKRLEEALESIREYWNRDNNNRAMVDACWYAIDTASEALEAKEVKS
jgi:small-conductance mechanosensitive channel